MAIYDLARSDLNQLMLSDPVDSSVRTSIINYLVGDGLLHGNDTVQVQASGSLDPSTQVYIADTPTATVATDANLDAIIMDPAVSKLTVTGSDGLIIGVGTGDPTIDISGTTGNDVVMGGSGGDTILG